jgi:hypothetical protein
MIVRYCAEFRSSLPEEDGVIGTDGDEKYAGPVAAAVCEILRRIGYEADDPMDAGDHGWEFEVRVKGYAKGRPKGGRFWCIVTLIDYYFLIFDNPSWWDKFTKRHPPLYIEALRALGREMAADPRFSELHWNLLEEAVRDCPGAPHPVEG